MSFFTNLSTPMKIGLLVIVAVAVYWYFNK